ncbi:MAG: GNAT family N-acetyltransferase [Clostridia bacterium]
MNLYTERLCLRNLGIEDIPDIYAYSKEQNVGPNAGWKPHESLEETTEIAKEIFIGKETVWGITLKGEDTVIGTIGLIEDSKRENHKAKMLGYAISEAYWGRGIMTEASKAVIEYGFKHMGLEVISAYCYPFNERSKKVLRKCGFEYEGVLRQAEKLYDGHVYDLICYSLLRK